jgi:hypothetical protein
MPYAAASAAAYPNVTALFGPAGWLVIVSVVNLPDAAVVEPIAVLLIVPVTVGLTISVPVPTGLIVILALLPFIVTLPVAVNVVTVAAAGVIFPMITLFIEPVIVAGAIAIVPVPVGLNVIVAFAELRFTVLVAVNVVNVPAFGVLAPIITLFIAPVVAGLTVKLLVTVKSAIELPVLMYNVLVVALVVTATPFVPTTFNTLLDA